MGKTSTSRPRTAEDIMALPIGPAFSTVEKIIDGKKVRVPVAPRTKVTFFGDDDIRACKDGNTWWVIGEYADGSWFLSSQDVGGVMWFLVGLIVGSAEHADSRQINVIAMGLCIVVFLLVFGAMDWWQRRR
jgi:hypothetical protein